MKIDLEKLRKSGRISATALAHGRKMIEPGAKLEDVQLAVEAKIREIVAGAVERRAASSASCIRQRTLSV